MKNLLITAKLSTESLQLLHLMGFELAQASHTSYNAVMDDISWHGHGFLGSIFHIEP
jgi:hypothetical protein